MNNISLSESKPATAEQKVSYGLGWQFGRHLLGLKFEELDLQMAYDGIKDCLADNQSPISDAEVEAAFKVVTAKVETKRQAEAVKMAARSQQYLQENAAREGIKITGSGLQYEVVEMGRGRVPGPLDSVVVHYHGTFFNRETFDSSVRRGEPVEFPVQDVIPGWTEVLQMMPTGSKWRVFVPAELAYGEKGNPPTIPGNCALIFEIELIDVV